MPKIAIFIIFLIFGIGTAFADKKLFYIYNEGVRNFISLNQVNAIEFSVPIVQVNSPPNQLISIFDKKKGAISYVNNNRTMLFYLSEKVETVQFMVTLKNGRVLSLYFNCDKGIGRIVHVPDALSGPSFQENSQIDGKNDGRKMKRGYDESIKKIMRSALFNEYLGDSWVKTEEIMENKAKDFEIKKYSEWNQRAYAKAPYKLVRWDFCSLSTRRLLMEDAILKRASDVLAFTVSPYLLFPNHCAKLIVLYKQGNDRAI